MVDSLLFNCFSGSSNFRRAGDFDYLLIGVFQMSRTVPDMLYRTSIRIVRKGNEYIVDVLNKS